MASVQVVCWSSHSEAVPVNFVYQLFVLDTCRPLGLSLDDEDDSPADNRQAVAFTFGCPHAWERFTVSPCSDL